MVYLLRSRGFFRCYGPRFRVNLLSLCCYFRCCRRFGGFFRLYIFFHSHYIRPKRECRLGWDIFAKRKQITSQSMCIRDNLLFRSLPLLVLIPERTWPVSSGCEMTCFRYITWTTISYSVHKHDFESPWLWYGNRGNSYISLPIFWLHLLT